MAKKPVKKKVGLSKTPQKSMNKDVDSKGIAREVNMLRDGTPRSTGLKAWEKLAAKDKKKGKKKSIAMDMVKGKKKAIKSQKDKLPSTAKAKKRRLARGAKKGTKK